MSFWDWIFNKQPKPSRPAKPRGLVAEKEVKESKKDKKVEADEQRSNRI